MTTVTPKAAKQSRLIGDILVNGSLLLLVLIWTIPTLGLLISSFRQREDILSTGWWKVLPHREWKTVEMIAAPRGVSRDQPIEVAGVTATFDEFRNGVTAPDGRRLIWIS